jgi:hypothetical protein
MERARSSRAIFFLAHVNVNVNVVQVVVESTALHHGETDKVLFQVPTAFRIHFQ